MLLDARGLGDLGFAFAGIGWGVGTGYRRVHEDFRWVDYAVVVAVCFAAAWFLYRHVFRRAHRCR